MTKSALCLVPAAILLISCSSSKPEPAEKGGTAAPQVFSQTKSKHRFAKSIELAGFRVAELKPGTLQIKFGAVNHSLADLGDLGMTVIIRARTAREEEPPLASFPCKVYLGPEEWKDVTVNLPTKLRVYELPDWQFLRASFEITSPAP